MTFCVTIHLWILTIKFIKIWSTISPQFLPNFSYCIRTLCRPESSTPNTIASVCHVMLPTLTRVLCQISSCWIRPCLTWCHF